MNKDDKIKEAIVKVGEQFGRAIKRLGEEHHDSWEERFLEEFVVFRDGDNYDNREASLVAASEALIFIRSAIEVAEKKGYAKGYDEGEKDSRAGIYDKERIITALSIYKSELRKGLEAIKFNDVHEIDGQDLLFLNQYFGEDKIQQIEAERRAGYKMAIDAAIKLLDN